MKPEALLEHTKFTIKTHTLNKLKMPELSFKIPCNLFLALSLVYTATLTYVRIEINSLYIFLGSTRHQFHILKLHKQLNDKNCIKF